MISITETAMKFFKACDDGKGWDACKSYCTADATFSAQAEPLVEIQSLEQYTEWMKGLLTIMPDAKYEIKSFATDKERNNVSAYAVITGTHTGEGGPVPPTGKKTEADYVYVMDFDGGKIKHMIKIWNAPWTMKELGWA
jgi:predicted ester cyclase